jgi:hypothetical protein
MDNMSLDAGNATVSISGLIYLFFQDLSSEIFMPESVGNLAWQTGGFL